MTNKRIMRFSVLFVLIFLLVGLNAVSAADDNSLSNLTDTYEPTVSNSQESVTEVISSEDASPEPQSAEISEDDVIEETDIEEEPKSDSGNNKVHTVTPVNYSKYFDSNGKLNSSLVKANDTLNLSGNFSKKNFIINIPFEGYQGITKKVTSVTAPNLNKSVWGTTSNIVASTKNASASEAGYVKYTIPTAATVPENGTITLNFSVSTDSNETVSISKIYTWTRSKAANDGANAVILTATTPDGTVFENGEGILTIKGTLYDGPAEATGVTYKYYNYSTTASPAGYVEITTVYNSSNPAPLSIAT